MRGRIKLLTIGALLSVLIAGCGSSSSSSSSGGASSSSSPNSAASAAGPGERYSTILDEQFAKTNVGLPETTIDVGGPKVKFKKGEPLKIAFSGYGSGFTYSPPEFAGIKNEAKRLKLQVTVFDPAGEPQKQVSEIQTAAASGNYNTFVVYPLETGLECSLLTKQLPAKGYLVIAVGQPACTNQTSTPGLLTVVDETGSPDVYGAWAEKIVKSNPGPQQVLVLTGPATDWLSQQAGIAMEDAAKANPNFHIEQVVRTDYTPAGALQKGQSALQQHPNTTIVADAFPEATQGMLTAVRTTGTQGKVKIFDFGTSAFGISQILSGGVQMSVPFYPYTKVKTALEAAVIARSGGTVPRYVTYAGHAPEPLRSTGDKVLFVTKQNAEQFRIKIAEY